MPRPRLMHEVLRELRGPMSRSHLSRLTVGPGQVYVGEKTIQALEEELGRVTKAEIIEALATALGVEPDVFYEYPIALAQREGRAAKDAKRDARQREAQALQDRAQQRSGHPEDAPDTRPAPQRRRSTGK
jgi:hypothetical protein